MFNKHTKNRRNINYIQPVEMYRQGINEDFQNNEQFGASLNAEVADCEFAENLSQFKETVNCINWLLEEHSDTSSDEGNLSADDDNNFDTTGDVEDDVNLLLNADIANVIQQAANIDCLSRHLQDMKGEIFGSQSASDLIHLKNALCLLSTVGNTPHSGRDIDSFLHLNNMQRIKIPGDGNCFFVSLATMIQQHLEKGSLNAEAKAHLENIGVIKSANTDIKQMAATLRETVVNEWLANSSSYEPFLTSGQDYISEAKAFLQDGYFASELGNSMPLAASNALRIPIVIFTEMVNFPVLPVCPRERTLSDNPIYLVYDMEFAGHYDGIHQKSTPQQEEQIQKSLPTELDTQYKMTCRCGQGAKKKKWEAFPVMNIGVAASAFKMSWGVIFIVSVLIATILEEREPPLPLPQPHAHLESDGIMTIPLKG